MNTPYIPSKADIQDLKTACGYPDVEKTHTEMVAALVKPGSDILEKLTPDDCVLLHAAVGISGESGELLDAIKKSVIYRKPLDRENVIEELGDLEFFIENLRSCLGITREETLAANIKKLSIRYPNWGYSDQRAQERADKEVPA